MGGVHAVGEGECFDPGDVHGHVAGCRASKLPLFRMSRGKARAGPSPRLDELGRHLLVELGGHLFVDGGACHQAGLAG